MIALIDTQMGNMNSVGFALERLGLSYQLTTKPEEIMAASRVILPGVGHAEAGMKRLKAAGLCEVIPKLAQPTLGICLGMQLLFESSEEGNVACLGVIPGKVRALQGAKAEPIPHMGWNRVRWIGEVPDVQLEGAYYYFVHSFGVEEGSYTLASCDYGGGFSAVVQKDNFTGIQFHPEKSGPEGELLLKYFLEH